MCKIMIGIVAKKDFFDEGVDRQIQARNIYNAEKQFEKSCELCVLYRKRMDCDCCPIKDAFERNLEKMKDTCPKIYYERVRRTLIEEEP